jgi:hypothetical protein
MRCIGRNGLRWFAVEVGIGTEYVRQPREDYLDENLVNKSLLRQGTVAN